MEASSSKAADGLLPEELELEDLWSELHTLKKLYGLLQKSNAKIPNGDNSSHECLDEKSRNVLKKLLDGATHQALQSQAQIVCYIPEPPRHSEKAANLEPPKTSISVEKEGDCPEEFQKCKEDDGQQGKAESVQSSSPSIKATTSHSQHSHEPNHGRKSCPSADRGRELVPARQAKAESIQSKHKPDPKLNLAEMKLGRGPCPSVSKIGLTRQNSRRSTAISEKRSTQHYPHRHIHPHDRRSWKPRTRNNTENRNQKQTIFLNLPERVKPLQSNGDLLAIVPAEKRARVEPTGQFGPSSRNQTRIVGRIDRELTHSKRGDTKERPRHKSRPPSRMGSLKDRESKSIALRDQKPIVVGDIKERRRRPPRQTSRGGRRSKPPSRLGSLKEREIKGIALKDQDQSVDISRGKNQAEHRNFRVVPRKPRRMNSVAYSSSSSRTMGSDTSTTSFTSSSRRQVTRRMGPTPPSRPPHPRRMPPKKDKEEEEGRLKRFKNKLAIIFHHHHHHIHDGGGHVEAGQRGGPQQHRHRSPWAYLKSVVHHTSAGEGKGRELVAKGPARVPAQQQQQQRQRGYLYAMLEGLIRHVWRTRRRNAGGRKMPRGVKGKKLHWWQRFRRRGGFRLANKKTPRLRLGFNRSHSRNTRNKTS